MRGQGGEALHGEVELGRRSLLPAAREVPCIAIGALTVLPLGGQRGVFLEREAMPAQLAREAQIECRTALIGAVGRRAFPAAARLRILGQRRVEARAQLSGDLRNLVETIVRCALPALRRA